MAVSRVLGIDPGSRVTGLGVIEAKGQTLRHIYSGCVRTTGSELGPRLGQIYRGVAHVIEKYKPDTISIEQVFMSKNAQSALVLGQARGAALLAAIHGQKAVSEYSALEIKNAIVGTGRATKEQVQQMVKMLLGLHDAPPTDAADALGCAICHIHNQQILRRISASDSVA
ncbi:MAG: crossover junction endodeoxyribonuclease RuvC [Acidiferrobacteraceae bacterium]|nr:crossover junction endodeoxyribonuclease RuvC [Acidiferrobacteraceae bacterium]